MQRYEYKLERVPVLTEEQLVEALNAFAREGWRTVLALAGQEVWKSEPHKKGGWNMTRTGTYELPVVLERRLDGF